MGGGFALLGAIRNVDASASYYGELPADPRVQPGRVAAGDVVLRDPSRLRATIWSIRWNPEWPACRLTT
ncbi:hypothetical protein [Actinophytocola sp.]|uniref:hypothetical protein n=1 Tax=Actinophytocola sp. TaxID=1872138 RepID=UPI003D6B0A4E